MKKSVYMVPETKISGTRLRTGLLAGSNINPAGKPRPNVNVDGTPIGGEVDPTLGFD